MAILNRTNARRASWAAAALVVVPLAGQSFVNSMNDWALKGHTAEDVGVLVKKNPALTDSQRERVVSYVVLDGNCGDLSEENGMQGNCTEGVKIKQNWEKTYPQHSLLELIKSL